MSKYKRYKLNIEVEADKDFDNGYMTAVEQYIINKLEFDLKLRVVTFKCRVKDE